MNVEATLEALRREPQSKEQFRQAALELGAALPTLSDKDLASLDTGLARLHVGPAADSAFIQGFREALAGVMSGTQQQRRRDKGQIARNLELEAIATREGWQRLIPLIGAGPFCLKDLEQAAGMAEEQVSRNLALMMREGILDRVRIKSPDKPVRFYQLTPEGQRLAARMATPKQHPSSRHARALLKKSFKRFSNPARQQGATQSTRFSAIQNRTAKPQKPTEEKLLPWMTFTRPHLHKEEMIHAHTAYHPTLMFLESASEIGVSKRNYEEALKVVVGELAAFMHQNQSAPTARFSADSSRLSILYQQLATTFLKRIPTTLRGNEEAFDAMQDMFILFLNITQHPRSDTSTTITRYRAAVDKVIAQLSFGARWSSTANLADVLVSDSSDRPRAKASSHDGGHSWTESLHDLERLMKGEKPRTIIVITLYFIGGFTIREVGQMLNLSRSMVVNVLQGFIKRAREYE